MRPLLCAQSLLARLLLETRAKGTFGVPWLSALNALERGNLGCVRLFGRTPARFGLREAVADRKR